MFKKEIALIKIDVECTEEKALKSGIEFITKNHVPFIIFEFSRKFLIDHWPNLNIFIQMFLDNGYKISTTGFFPLIYDSIILYYF